MPFFDMSKASDPGNEYVCWLDIMGTKNKMLTSVKQSSNFIFKFHVAILKAIETASKITAYPVMDGVYLTSPNKDAILKVISKIFFLMAKQFLYEEKFFHLYMIKGAIAYGPIYHGKDIPDAANDIFKDSATANYKRSILLGIPMVLACQGEKNAPPFGLFVDETARNTLNPIPTKWYRWDFNRVNSNDFIKIKEAFIKKVNKFYACCEKSYMEIDYPLEKIQAHRAAFNMYFSTHPKKTVIVRFPKR